MCPHRNRWGTGLTGGPVCFARRGPKVLSGPSLTVPSSVTQCQVAHLRVTCTRTAHQVTQTVGVTWQWNPMSCRRRGSSKLRRPRHTFGCSPGPRPGAVQQRARPTRLQRDRAARRNPVLGDPAPQSRSRILRASLVADWLGERGSGCNTWRSEWPNL